MCASDIKYPPPHTWMTQRALAVRCVEEDRCVYVCGGGYLCERGGGYLDDTEGVGSEVCGESSGMER